MIGNAWLILHQQMHDHPSTSAGPVNEPSFLVCVLILVVSGLIATYLFRE